MTPQQIDDLIRLANWARKNIELILDVAKKHEGLPLPNQDSDTLVDAINVLRGFRKDLQLILMKEGAQRFIRDNQK